MSIGKYDNVQDTNIGKVTVLTTANIGKASGYDGGLLVHAWATTTSSLAAGFSIGAGNTLSAIAMKREMATEKWNGASWASTTARTYGSDYYFGGCGNASQAICAGGSYVDSSTAWYGARSFPATWNNNTWSVIPGMISSAMVHVVVGSYSSAAALGGMNSSYGQQSYFQRWNGVSWSGYESGYYSTGISHHQMCGSTSSAICIGGNTSYSQQYGTITNVCKVWNGSSWSTIPSISVARQQGAAIGTPAAAMVFGGQTTGTGGLVATAEQWDGSAWATAASMSQARNSIGAAGDTAGILAISGNTGANVTTCEIWT